MIVAEASASSPPGKNTSLATVGAPLRAGKESILQTDKPVAELFSLTNRNELGQIPNFLHELVEGIWHLYQNGIKPEFGRQRPAYNDSEATRSAREVINKVTGLQPALDD